MPTYDYKCTACETHVEHILSIANRENPGPCAKCGGTLRQVITPPLVMFDGADTGFPGASMKWDRDRARTMQREQKNLRETGDYYKSKRHW